MTQARQVGSGVPALSIRFAEESNIGLRKKEQQDYQGHLYIAPEEHPDGPLCLFMVCDGVSMGMAGALASRTAVELTLQGFPVYLTQGYEPILALQAALQDANSAVVRLAANRPGMATTCVAALLIGNQLFVAHIGDSRAYLVRYSQNLSLLTTDHSWTEEYGRSMVKQGLMTDEELRRDGRRHSITRAMGLQDDMSFDFNQETLQEADRILLCSDGLWDSIENEYLQQLVTEEQGNQSDDVLPNVAHNLMAAALEAGGRDNITLSLIEVDEIGQTYMKNATSSLVEETRHDIQARTGVNQSYDNNSGDAPTVQMPLPPKNLTNKPVENPVINQSKPTPAHLNEDLLFQRVQKLYAIGEFEEAVNLMLTLEQLSPNRNGLFDMMSNSLVRIVAAAATRGNVEQILELFDQMEDANITRYRQMLFDFCMRENQEAEQARNYDIVRDYAVLALRLQPNDSRARSLLELSESYLHFQNDDLPLEERLNLGQNLYARSPDFGGIQDDLARLYLELGDSAAAEHSDDEAIDWYQMVRSLRPRDSRIYSLAITKQRVLEDTMQREAEKASAQKDLDFIKANNNNFELNQPEETEVTSPPDNKAVSKSYEKEEIKPDVEGINRLKDRVSRSQKAWDNGRREVGSEYIYLVEQLTNILSPNPWQPTYPRVCYDYGKWLFEQHQYREARPYFEKASTLGVGAAQQKLREIDRMAEAGEIPSGFGSSRFSSAHKPESKIVEAVPEKKVKVEEEYSEEPLAPRPVPNILGLRQPLITPLNEIPNEKNFVGASHAGDGVLGPASRVPLRQPSDPVEPDNADMPATLQNDKSAADSGTDFPVANSEELTSASPIRRAARYLKSEHMVGATGLRTPVNANTNKSLQLAVARELERLNTTGVPQYVAPQRAANRRALAMLDLVRALWLPVVLGLIVLVVFFTLGLSFLTSKPKQEASLTTEAAATVDVLPTTTSVLSTATPAPEPTVAPIVPHATVSFNGANPDDYNLYLGMQSSGLKNLVPLTLTDKSTGLFNLKQGDISKIDRSQSYFVLARPKDTATRKYLPDLALNDPSQTMYVQGQLTFDVAYNVNARFNIATQALNFYPLDGGSRDGDAQGGGFYYSVTHHIVRPDFLKFYQANGDVNRWGFPISEDFDLPQVGHVQFFERGWLIRNADGSITPGAIGKTLLTSQCVSKATPVMPPAKTVPNETTFNTANSFANFAPKNNLGNPVSEFFFLQAAANRKLYQYFEFGRLEMAQNSPTAAIELGLVGTEYARCQGWIS